MSSGCKEEKPVQPSLLSRDEYRTESTQARYAHGELIVKFKPDAFDEEGRLVSESIKALNSRYGLDSMEPLFKGRRSGSLGYIYKLKFPSDADVLHLTGQYNQDPLVEYAEPNYIVQAMP